MEIFSKTMKLIKTILFLIPIIICIVSDTQKTNSQEKNVLISMTGKITDASSKKPLNATIIFYDRNNKKIGSSKTNIITGHYFFSGLKPGKPYVMIIEIEETSKEMCDVIIPFVKENVIYTKDFCLK